MDVSRYIARRLRFKGRIAMVSIAVSFFVMMISVSISSGFRHEIRDGISLLSGDVQLTPGNLNFLDESEPVGRCPSYMGHLMSLDGVESVSPVVYKAGIVKMVGDIQGVMFKGVEDPGTVAGIDSIPPLGTVVPSGLASALDLEPGDTLPSYFIGERVRVRNFTVSSVYDGMFGSDAQDMVVYACLSDLQRLNGWDEDQVSALEVKLDRRYRDTGGMELMQQEIGNITLLYADGTSSSVVARSAVSRFPQIFDWLDLIDFNVFFILLLMTAVAGFNMISGLLIMLFENISTIGLLKSIGMDDRRIARIFLLSASSAVLKGMLAGNAAALLFCLVQGTTHAIRLDPANYFLAFVPVHVNLPMFLLADLAAYLVIMLLLLIPSMFITKIDPATTVRVA